MEAYSAFNRYTSKEFDYSASFSVTTTSLLPSQMIETQAKPVCDDVSPRLNETPWSQIRNFKTNRSNDSPAKFKHLIVARRFRTGRTPPFLLHAFFLEGKQCCLIVPLQRNLDAMMHPVVTAGLLWDSRVEFAYYCLNAIFARFV